MYASLYVQDFDLKELLSGLNAHEAGKNRKDSGGE